jgi:hypothetical protein
MTNVDATVSPETPAPRLDLAYLFGFAFKDPNAFRKWLLGCLAVFLIPFLGFGLVWLLGFAVQTGRGAMRGEPNPMPGWEGMARQLSDGLRAVAVVLVYAAAVTIVGGVLFLVSSLIGLVAVGIVGGVFAGVVGAAIDTGVAPDVFGQILPELVAVPVAGAGLLGASVVFGLVVTGWFVVLLAGFAKALLPAGLMQLVATGRVRPALAWIRNLRRVRAHPGTYILLLVLLVLFGILANFSLSLFLVGIVPGLFWAFTAAGAAIGHAGRIMGVEVEATETADHS